MKIYLLGAANPEIVRMVRAVQRVSPNGEFALLDNDVTKQGRDFHGMSVLGGVDLVPTLVEQASWQSHAIGFVNLITGSTRTRYETTHQIVDAGGQLVNFLHPSIDLTMTHVGVGNYLQEGVILQAEVAVGDNSSISMGALVGHESRIGHSVFIAPGVSIAGCCEIGDGTFIGTNATVLPRLRIGRWATIGAGAVITRDVPDHAVMVGNPARQIKTNDIPYADGRIA